LFSFDKKAVGALQEQGVAAGRSSRPRQILFLLARRLRFEYSVLTTNGALASWLEFELS
jgi:hypothetical protein